VADAAGGRGVWRRGGFASRRGGDCQGLRMNIESIERFAKEGTAAGAKQSLAFDGYLGGF
jgi:hypothetical protein